MSSNQPFAVFDLDGTLIRWQLLHALFIELDKLQLVTRENNLAVNKYLLQWRQRQNPDSFLHFENQLVAVFCQSIAGQPLKLLDEISLKVFEEHKKLVYTYTSNLILKLKKNGYFIIAQSGSPKNIVKLIANYYGFDSYNGSEFLHHQEILTGQAVPNVRDKKVANLKNIINRHKLTNLADKPSLAIGDTYSDIAMLEFTQQQIVFNPTHDLYEYARKKHWPIVIERKNVIYKLNYQNGTYQLLA